MPDRALLLLIFCGMALVIVGGGMTIAGLIALGWRRH